MVCASAAFLDHPREECSPCGGLRFLFRVCLESGRLFLAAGDFCADSFCLCRGARGIHGVLGGAGAFFLPESGLSAVGPAGRGGTDGGILPFSSGDGDCRGAFAFGVVGLPGMDPFLDFYRIPLESARDFPMEECDHHPDLRVHRGVRRELSADIHEPGAFFRPSRILEEFQRREVQTALSLDPGLPRNHLLHLVRTGKTGGI